MSDLPSHPLVWRDARLAGYATRASPVWLWSLDGTRILWANPVGAAIFGARNARELASRHFEPSLPTAKQIARLAGSLSHGGTPRLERLRGFGTGLGRALLCACSRIALADQTRAVLIAAGEPAGPSLSLSQRVRRLCDEIPEENAEASLAVFMPDGTLLAATPDGMRRLATATSLAAFGAEAIGAQALASARASGSTQLGVIDIARLGSGSDLVLAANFAANTTPLPHEAERAPEQTSIDTPMQAPMQPPEIPPVEHASLPAAPEAADALAFDDASLSVAPEDPLFADLESGSAPDALFDAIMNDAEPPALTFDFPMAERRHPLRFVWQMDTEGRFNLGSDEFTEVIGPKIAIALGRPWTEVAAELSLDPEGQVERAVATRDTWSGITLSWPVDGTDERLKVELSGLPIYDRNRLFVGYRGFGVCRDIDRINVLAQMRRNAPVFAPTTPAAAADLAARSREALAAVMGGSRAGGARSDAARDPGDERPPLSLVPSAKNVVPFRGAGAAADPRSPALSPVERSAFRELARQLTARLKGETSDGEPGEHQDSDLLPSADGTSLADVRAAALAARDAVPPRGPDGATGDRPLLDRLPVGVLVYRFDQLIYANRAFLDWTGYEDLHALTEAGGLDTLFVEGDISPAGEITGQGKSITIAASSGDKLPVDGRLFSLPWNGEPALVLMLVSAGIDGGRKVAEPPVAAANLGVGLGTDLGTGGEADELRSLLDSALDGLVTIDRGGRILAFNRAAAALFGRDAGDFINVILTDLLALESRRLVREDLDALVGGATATTAPQRTVAARARDGGQMHLVMTMSRLAGSDERFCVVLRDVTAFRNSERELSAAKRQADKASADKSEFLAKISHDVRTPLNSIIGFSEIMIEERFGPIGNERYREYLKDIRASGSHAVSLLNDLLDLSKIESGELDLTFVGVHLNDMVQSCVALMQPQANREQIIMRTSLLPSLRPVVADARSVRQIVINLLSNSIRFTGSGGQVIVSTALADDGKVVLRVRDTGIGMNDTDLMAALEPFRQQATSSRWGTSGSGLGLPLTRALAEANHATFAISSKVNEGTLVEIAFPATRVLAD